MFIWLTLRDEPTYTTWDSGLIGDAGARKPAFAALAAAAAGLDARNPVDRRARWNEPTRSTATRRSRCRSPACARGRYRVYIGDVNDSHGNRVSRTATVIGVPAFDRPG